MIEIGRICVKIAGRDAGKKCVVLDSVTKSCVLIDGETRRRKCNVLHLEPIAQVVKIGKGASHEEVVKVFKELGIVLAEKTRKARTGKSAVKPAAKPAPSKTAPKKAAEKKQ